MTNRKAGVRERSFDLRIAAVDAATNTSRQALIAPSKGKRVRFIRASVFQVTTDGRHLWELYFGAGANIITDPNNSVDVLIVPDLGGVSTRTFAGLQGPRGERDETLSGRWRGTAPTTVHKVIIEYTEES